MCQCKVVQSLGPVIVLLNFVFGGLPLGENFDVNFGSVIFWAWFLRLILGVLHDKLAVYPNDWRLSKLFVKILVPTSYKTKSNRYKDRSGNVLEEILRLL